MGLVECSAGRRELRQQEESGVGAFGRADGIATDNPAIPRRILPLLVMLEQESVGRAHTVESGG